MPMKSDSFSTEVIHLAENLGKPQPFSANDCDARRSYDTP